MIAQLVRKSIQYRWLVILFTAVIAVIGWRAFQNLPIDAVPDITNVQVQVMTAGEGMSPEELERSVSVPLETGLNGIPGVTQVRSITRFGISVVTVVFEEGTDIYRARQLVSERLQTVGTQLPPTTHPRLGPVSSGLGEIYHYVVEADQVAEGPKRAEQLMELRAIQDWFIKPRLLTVKGVAEINTIGGYERQFHIQPDPRKMGKYGIHFGDIEEAIEKVNQNVGGGYVEQTGEQFLVQATGLFKSLDDIRAVPIRSLENFRTISIGEIAEVKLGRELRTGAALHNGKEVVLGTAMMLLGENSRTVALRVAEQVEEIKRGLPKGYHIQTLYDRSELVNATLGTVEHNLMVGAALVIIILLLLVGNIRAAIITAIVIPLSLLFTFISMRWFGISGNLVSLGALDFGIIVDGAVIVLDNCVRHLHDRSQALKRSLTELEVQESVYDATVEIRKSAGFGELVIVVVFLPIFAFVGIEGKMFVPMAATFISALIAALLLSFTFVPALASLLLRGQVEDKEPRLMHWFQALYQPALHWSLVRRRAVLSIAIASVLAGAVLFRTLGGEFLPQLNEGSIAVQFIRPASVGLSHAVAFEEKSHSVIKSFAEVSDVFGRLGTAEVATDPMGPNIADTYVMLKPEDQWPKIDGRIRTKDELVAAMSERLEALIPGQNLLFSQPIQLRFNELIEGTRADVSLKIYGEDQAVLSEIAEEVSAVLSKVPGAGDVEAEGSGMASILEVLPKKEVLRSMGVSSREVLETVGVGIAGDEVGVFYEGMRRSPIIVRLSDEDRGDIQAIRELPVGFSGNVTVPLREVADTRFKQTFSSYSREQTKRRVAVLINPRGRDTESFVAEAQAAVAQAVKLPPGYYLEWGGNFRNLQEAKSRLALLAPLALLMVLLMIYAAFRNLLETILIFCCVPLALVGGVLGLIVAGLPFSISAGVGFIALSGIAVLNGVVLVNYFNDLKAQGMSGEALVTKGATLRLRPVLMTALVDIFGFLPMAVSHGMGAEVQRPLASVVIGGVISSTLLTLIILPAIYLALEKHIIRFGHVGHAGPNAG